MSVTSTDIQLVTAADSRYVPYLSAMLTSVRDNLDPASRLHVTVLTRDVDPVSVRWPNCGSLDSLRCFPPEVPSGNALSIRPHDHLTVETYYRLFLESAFDDAVKRIVYLDSDLVVLGDLSRLASVDLGGKTVGAVMDFGIRRWDGARTCEALKSQSQATGRGYFNAGVLVIDLDAWRGRRVRDVACRFLSENLDRILFHDQDALNHALADDWHGIDPRWNRMCYWDHPEFNDPPFPSEVMASLAKPYVVHFTGGRKPWNYYWHEARECFERYATMAGFGEHRITMAKAAWFGLRDRFQRYRRGIRSKARFAG
jgi:lipopolysaccharide biosynthesis glycosyltransferase